MSKDPRSPTGSVWARIEALEAAGGGGGGGEVTAVASPIYEARRTAGDLAIDGGDWHAVSFQNIASTPADADPNAAILTQPGGNVSVEAAGFYRVDVVVGMQTASANFQVRVYVFDQGVGADDAHSPAARGSILDSQGMTFGALPKASLSGLIRLSQPSAVMTVLVYDGQANVIKDAVIRIQRADAVGAGSANREPYVDAGYPIPTTDADGKPVNYGGDNPDVQNGDKYFAAQDGGFYEYITYPASDVPREEYDPDTGTFKPVLDGDGNQIVDHYPAGANFVQLFQVATGAPAPSQFKYLQARQSSANPMAFPAGQTTLIAFDDSYNASAGSLVVDPADDHYVRGADGDPDNRMVFLNFAMDVNVPNGAALGSVTAKLVVQVSDGAGGWNPTNLTGASASGLAVAGVLGVRSGPCSGGPNFRYGIAVTVAAGVNGVTGSPSLGIWRS